MENIDDMKSMRLSALTVAMIASEVQDFKQNLREGKSDFASLPSVAKPSAPLPGPTRSPIDGMERDDLNDESAGMDIDSELRMLEEKKPL